MVVAQLSGSTLLLINLVTLHLAWLLLGWVNICGHINLLGM